MALIIVATAAGPAGQAHADDAADVPELTAIEAIAPEVLGSASPSTETGATETSTEIVGGGELRVSTDPTDGIRFEDGTSRITIDLPGPRGTSDADVDESGVSTFTSPNSTGTVVVPTDDGVAVNTVIDGPSAPETFTYPLTLPEGAALDLRSDGGAVIEKDGTILASIAPPWAMDANRHAVPTHFTIDGHVLVQVVDHRLESTSYPVVADPKVAFGRYVYVRLSPNDQKFLLTLSSGAAAASLCAGTLGIGCGVAIVVAAAVSAYFNPKCWIEVKVSYGGHLAGVNRKWRC